MQNPFQVSSCMVRTLTIMDSPGLSVPNFCYAPVLISKAKLTKTQEPRAPPPRIPAPGGFRLFPQSPHVSTLQN